MICRDVSKLHIRIRLVCHLTFITYDIPALAKYVESLLLYRIVYGDICKYHVFYIFWKTNNFPFSLIQCHLSHLIQKIENSTLLILIYLKIFDSIEKYNFGSEETGRQKLYYNGKMKNRALNRYNRYGADKFFSEMTYF